MGMKLMYRDEEIIRIENVLGREEEYHILDNFPFSSETKRAGIILRHVESGKIVFYVKGADTVMK
jgi:phospholipid-translocating ATPase